MTLRVEFITSLSQVAPRQWNRLFATDHPFVSHAFLLALEDSLAVGPGSGWQSLHSLFYQGEQLIGALPGYIKTHSYGEYIFDFAWADAYARHGMDYYPKLVHAVPFTPVTGPRLGLVGEVDQTAALNAYLAALAPLQQKLALSSCHWLFTDKQACQGMVQHGFIQRQAVQFQWHNRGYGDFNDFLARCSARHRKQMRKERNKVASQGIEVRRLSGAEISPGDMAFFYRCYRHTYIKRSGHEGYLNEATFQQWRAHLADHLLLVQASYTSGAGKARPVASALYFFDQQGLYGRYWGALEQVDALHFECCLYQGIDFAIERGLSLFNPGTQGEHKIARGFEPIDCYSAHALSAPDFTPAIRRFVADESRELNVYKDAARQRLPFKTGLCW